MKKQNECSQQSAEAAAQGNPVSHGQLAYLNPRISRERLVELQHEVAVVPNVLPQRRIRWGHHGPVPQGVVVPDHTSYFDQINQPLVVV